MGEWSIWHWLVVLLIVLLIFGAGKLKNIGPDLGSAVREFKKAMHGGDKEEKKETDPHAEHMQADDSAAADAADSSRKSDGDGGKKPPGASGS